MKNELGSSKTSGGVVGENALWDGPLSQENRTHGKGSSSGINGIKLKFMQPDGSISGGCGCGGQNEPITSRAKR
jgi:hypothetical protein